ncbi:MAG: RecQ family ATP-dependent DNA helicase [Treponema sp.]|jgi:ATP-dependent DNA helicase RecQ|nr:RecQ family ATP-dependent DNA helicase [Treponema sp.]
MNSEIFDPIENAVQQFFGLSYLFPYQRLVITNIFEAARIFHIPFTMPDISLLFDDTFESDNSNNAGRHIVILPTGAGKSLCFQLPALVLKGATLIIYPILSLMADQERRLKERGFDPVILRGGQTIEERMMFFEKVRSGKSRFIIATPEVLLNERLLNILKTLNIIHFVVDEAHCVSEWGESFRPKYREISTIIEAAQAPLLTAFTATASEQVLEKIEQYIFANCGSRKIIANPDRPNIYYSAQGCIVPNVAVRDILIKAQKPAIVFCSSRFGTEQLARYLRDDLSRNEIYFYHAGLQREEKTAIEQWFFNSEHGILVTTCAYGMGVDKPNVRTVIHRDCPPSVEAYVQESGRAGRDGLASQAILLFGPHYSSHIQRVYNAYGKIRMRRLFNYAYNISQCRRAMLLDLLKYDSALLSVPDTGCCDVCDNTAQAALREEFVVHAFIKKNSARYTMFEAAQILAQQKTLNISVKDAFTILNYLVRKGALQRMSIPLWKNRLIAKKR